MSIKKYRYPVLILLTLLISIIFGPNIASAETSWQPVGSPGFSSSAVDSGVSIALDSSGTPYVVYADSGNDQKATVMKYTSDSWQIVGSPGFSAARVNCHSIVIDNNGIPYVSYQDDGNAGKATVMKYNGSSWQPVGSPGFSAGASSYNSMAFDSKGIPYVAYRDYPMLCKATVMKYNGTSWQNVGSPGFSDGEAIETQIAIDSSDVPYVVYMDGKIDEKATVMKYNGSIWEPVGNMGFSVSKAFYPQIAIDSSDVPYAVFMDGGNDEKATVMKYNGSIWEPVGNMGFSVSQAFYPSIAIDSHGVPYVVYDDRGYESKATVMKYNGSIWEPVGNPGFSAGTPWGPSIAIDSNRTIYVAYEDGGNSNKATVMKYENLGSPDGSYVPVTNIAITPPEPINDGNPVALQYTISPSNATYKNIKWTTSNPAVAACYNGVVYPRSVGTATITAQAIYGSASEQCFITVGSLLTDDDARIIREAALATLTDEDWINAPLLIGYNVKEVLDNKKSFNTPMFTVSGKDLKRYDLYLNQDRRVNIGEYLIMATSSGTRYYSDDAHMDAVAYQNINGDIVIAYAGTSRAYSDADTLEATWPLLRDGSLETQFDYALGFYNYVHDANPGKNITLIGHSLGGALAAYVSIMEGGVKADCFNDAAGHAILHAYVNDPEKVAAFPGINVTGYTSYLNTDVDPYVLIVDYKGVKFKPSSMGFNDWVTEFKDRRNHYEYGSNNYSHPANDFWHHELAAILSYENGNFGFYYKRDHTTISTTEISIPGVGLVLGTDGNNTLNTAGNSGTQVVYTGNGTDTVYGRSLWGDTIVASGTGSKSLYGRGGSDTYIIDISQIDSKITIDDPSGRNDAILLKNVIDDQDTANINEYTIQQTGDYYYINFGNNRSIYVKKHRDWTQPAIHLKDNNGHSTDFKTDSGQMVSVNGPAINAPTIQLLKATEIETADIDQTGVTLKSLRLTGNVVVKVYDQLGSLLGEYNDSGNDVQTADFGYFYPVNADGQQYMDIDLINGNYILKVTSPGSVDFVVYDPDSGGVIKYEKNGIDLSDGSILVIDTNFIDTENKFKLENGQNVSPITASEYVAAQQVTLDQNNIYLKTGGSQLINATLTPQNVMNSTVSWSVIQPDENITVAGVGANDDGAATVTGISAGTATLRAAVQDGSGIYVDIPITVTQDEAPSNTAVDAEGESYSSGSWTQSQSVTITPELPYGYNQICIFDGYSWTYSNSLTITDGGQHDVLYYAENSNTGEYTAMGSLQVNIDQAPPAIEGVDADGQYYIDRLVRVSDDGLLDSVSANGTSFTEDEVASGKWFADPGVYSIYARDAIGRETVVDFEIKAKPDPDTATLNDLPTIQSIRDEFESVKYDLPAERIEILEQEIAAVETALTNILNIPVLVSIGITSPANKLVYTVGDALDLTGVVVTGTYSDDSTTVLPITAANVTGFNSSTPVPSQTLTVTVDGMTATYIVSIVALTGYALSGQVLVEGDDLTEGQTHYSGGVTIELKQGEEIKYSTISSEAEDLASNGSFSLIGITAGDYLVVISKAGYLTRSFALTINSDLTLSTTSNEYLNRIYLLAGDIVIDEYNVIAASDVNYILSKFNSNSTQAGFDPQVDIVKDQYNVISAADVNLMLSNFNKNSTQYPADIVY